MNSHCFDVIIVGAGISGLVAAGTVARHGQKVALVAAGPGPFVLRSGCLRAGEFIQSRATHELREAVAFFQEMTQAAGYPFEGDISGECLLPTILGGFHSVALAPRTLWNAEPRNGTTNVIVGIRELSCFDESFMAERLNEQTHGLGLACTFTARQISLAHIFGPTATALRIAARFDSDPAFRSELVRSLRLEASGFARIFVPGILGLQSSAKLLVQFERDLGCLLCELPTLPPSVPGLRLFHRLMSYLCQIGVELLEGFPVANLQIHDGCCTELQIASPGHFMNLRGECVVLSAGQDSTRLFGAACAGHDQQMRPVTFSGSVLAWNVFDAESGANDGAENRGDVAEILAGYRAGNLAAATRGHYAAR